MNAQLHGLLAAAHELVPGWQGQWAVRTRHAPWCSPDRGELAALHEGLRRRHPEAGRAYAALRGWGLLVWQPVYLAVIGCHVQRVAWQCDALHQPVEQGAVPGFVLLDHVPRQHTGEDACRAVMAAELVPRCDRLAAEWQALTALHGRSARRVLADCVLEALLLVQRLRHDWSRDDVRRHGDRWLLALGLTGESGYLVYRDTGGAERLALERRICCLHFRRAGGEPCATCPRLPLAQRLRTLAG